MPFGLKNRRFTEQERVPEPTHAQLINGRAGVALSDAAVEGYRVDAGRAQREANAEWAAHEAQCKARREAARKHDEAIWAAVQAR